MAWEQDLGQVAKIKVIGVGGGGCNAVNRMVNEGVEGVEFIVANTDAQVLAISKAKRKIILGEKISKGLGAGANPEVGKAAAIESTDLIREALDGADLIFIAAGMGGGTGTGAAPIIAKIAQDCGALVVAIVTKPFRFEGRNRNKFALQGLEELKKNVDSVIVISNDKLLEYIGGLPLQDSFKEADNILKQGVQTITDLIAVPAIINLDFADVRTVMSQKGNALFGIGIAEGNDKAVQAANKAINSALLEASIKGAKDVIVNVTGGKTVSLNDAYDAVDIIQQAVQNDDVNIVFGIAINDQLNDELIVTVIATGFDEPKATVIGDPQLQRPQANNQAHQNHPESRHLNNQTNVESELQKNIEIIHPAHNFNQAYKNNQNQNKNTMSLDFESLDDDFPTFLR